MDEKKLYSLLENCPTGGCGAKISPGELSGILSGLPMQNNENLLVGYESSDDAAVYKIDGTRSIVMTVDFFPPMLDDAGAFGRIAAANALSDIYAMGATPLAALNLVCFPQSMDMSVLKEILAGGAQKVMEAGAVLSGGHSIYDRQPKYGLAVTGIADTGKIIRNNTPALSDKLILTKPLGVGIIMAAHREGTADGDAVARAVASMERLNKYAAEKMAGFCVHACTDVTGFGVLTHALEMVSERYTAVLWPDELPRFDEALAMAGEDMITSAGRRNRGYLSGRVDTARVSPGLQELMFDPQTSGGLLISVAGDQATELLSAIREGDPAAKVIGEITEREEQAILLR